MVLISTFTFNTFWHSLRFVLYINYFHYNSFCTTKILERGKRLKEKCESLFKESLQKINFSIIFIDKTMKNIFLITTYHFTCFSYLLLGSLGPSTVTFIALTYVATCGGEVLSVIVNAKLFPVNKKEYSVNQQYSKHKH